VSSDNGTISKRKSSSKGKAVVVPTDRPVRVYADGIYDMFHYGHARSLQQAKLLFPNTYLIVGVCDDELTHRLKGKTVMDEMERAESLRHCKWVDEVVEHAPWIVTQEFLDEHKIDFVAHGQDIILDENGKDVYDFVKKAGKYQTIKRTEGISTSDLILRIVRDYDAYVRRNLARGYSGKDMNVGFLKEKQILVEDQLKKLKNKVVEGEHQIVNFIRKFGYKVDKLVHPFRKQGQLTGDDEYVLSPNSTLSSPPTSPPYTNIPLSP